MSAEPGENDILVQFEIQNLPEEYREYYKIKRNNFFATIQNLPELWEFFCKIDKIWKREIDDLEVGISATTSLPILLYINAHSKVRISMELAFSACPQEARSVLRDAVESVAHAHHMLSDPKRIEIWLAKDDSGGRVAFKRVFVDNRATNLFKGLGELYEKFGQLSETGSHPTIASFYNKLTTQKTTTGSKMSLAYTGSRNTREFALELFSRLLTCFVMERTLFDDFQTRLRLDPQLIQMRGEFENFKENLRREVIKRYDVKPPPQNH